jgi:catechol 2,3-dioxygenase-like lactoylglutathione lyase family enzyme
VIADVLHFSFTVSDLDRSAAWYTEVLGLELVHRQDQDNPYTRTLVGIPGAVLRVAQFRIPGQRLAYSTHMLELVQYVKGGDQGEPGPVNRVAGAHLAFIVTNVHQDYGRMRALGVRFRNPPVAITAGANEGGWACYLSDPDGATIELMQLPPGRAPAIPRGSGE